MDLLDQLRAFVATAQSGSFTAGAEKLGMSNRLTSKYVAELEERLGVRLFQRTTRKVGLTPAGTDLLSRAPALLDDFEVPMSILRQGRRVVLEPRAMVYDVLQKSTSGERTRKPDVPVL